MSNNIASVSELRSRAWNAMTMTWSTVLSISCIINLTSTVGSEILSYLPGGTLLYMVLVLLLNVPTMGLINGTMSYLRRGIISFDHISSMFPYVKQVVCYSIWEGLHLFLWMLPGVIVSGVGTGFAIVSEEQTTAIIGLVLSTVGLILMVVLGVRAGLNYLLAPCCLIDTPHMGGLAALGRSKELMRGHRWRFIRMNLPIILMEIIIGVISAMLSGSVDPMLLSVIISILSIAPEVMSRYLTSVLYQELQDR